MEELSNGLSDKFKRKASWIYEGIVSIKRLNLIKEFSKERRRFVRGIYGL